MVTDFGGQGGFGYYQRLDLLLNNDLFKPEIRIPLNQSPCKLYTHPFNVQNHQPTNPFWKQPPSPPYSVPLFRIVLCEMYRARPCLLPDSNGPPKPIGLYYWKGGLLGT